MTSPDRDQPPTPADGFLPRYAEAALLREAHAVTHGERHLTVEHGYPETGEETARREQLSDPAWRGFPGARTRSIGGGGTRRLAKTSKK
ncbi:hypothetical protein [Nocardia sp. NPDC050710]|uniref:hypothetical protein n=1 Tax=Nocardia sp. NPDC050710 TaxID=3157220 RepID=UPI0033F05E3D